MNVVYLRLLVIFVSLLGTETETGLFATSFRVFEMLVGLPTLVLSVALPLLAVAGADDRPRFRFGMQRLLEIALVVSLFEVVVVFAVAEPALPAARRRGVRRRSPDPEDPGSGPRRRLPRASR